MSPDHPKEAEVVAEIRSFLFVLNDGPYGSERPYNALRHSMNLAKREGVRLRVFLVGDEVQGARKAITARSA